MLRFWYNIDTWWIRYQGRPANYYVGLCDTLSALGIFINGFLCL
jgi:hypothetical protein